MKNYFPNTHKETAKMNELLESLEKEAVLAGSKASGINPYNALQALASVSRSYQEAQNTALELGYSSLPIALKALSQYKDNQANGINKLPEVFHTVPHGWIYGKADSAPNKQDGWKPLSLSQAQRRHRVIVPLLIEAWELTDGDDETREDIEYCYRTRSDVDFEKELYKYIHVLEPLPLEEEFKRVLPANDEDAAESLRLVTDPDIIYGVVKKKKKKDTED